MGCTHVDEVSVSLEPVDDPKSEEIINSEIEVVSESLIRQSEPTVIEKPRDQGVVDTPVNEPGRNVIEGVTELVPKS